MIDRIEFDAWLDECLAPVLVIAERYSSRCVPVTRESRLQRLADLVSLRTFVESDCPRCPLGYRNGTVDALLLHLLIVLDSSFRVKLVRLRSLLRELALSGNVPELFASGHGEPVYEHGRRVLPSRLARGASDESTAVRPPIPPLDAASAPLIALRSPRRIDAAQGERSPGKGGRTVTFEEKRA